MISNLKTELFSVPNGRADDKTEVHEAHGANGWIVDFSPDNVVNTALRKEELMDFAMFNEGNVYSKLFNKVSCHVAK